MWSLSAKPAFAGTATSPTQRRTAEEDFAPCRDYIGSQRKLLHVETGLRRVEFERQTRG